MYARVGAGRLQDVARATKKSARGARSAPKVILLCVVHRFLPSVGCALL